MRASSINVLLLCDVVVDVLGEVDNNFSNKDLNQPPDIAPAEAENETSPPKIVLNDGNPSPDTSLSDPPKVWLNLSDKKSASEECDSNNNSKELVRRSLYTCLL